MASVKTGYDATLTVTSGSTYTGGELTNVRAFISEEPVDISDLGSIWRERENGLLDWEIAGTKNVAAMASGFLALARLVGTVTVSIKEPGGTGIAFSGVGIITRGGVDFPMGATTEEISIVGDGTAPSVPA